MSQTEKKFEKKELPLREIQQISNAIDDLKNPTICDQAKVQEIDAYGRYWVGRLRQWCEPKVRSIEDTRNGIMMKHTFSINPDGTRQINMEKATFEIKDMLEKTDILKFPKLKASTFVSKDKSKSLVPISFWEAMTNHIELDVDWMEGGEDEEPTVEPKPE